MRLLMLTPSLPYPPHQGGAIRNFGILNGLYRAGHRITLVSFHDNVLPVASTPLAERCERIETVPFPTRSMLRRAAGLFLSSQPDLARRLESAAYSNKLKEVLSSGQYDLVQIEGLEMAGYLPLIRQIQPEAKICYDAHNAEYALQKVFFGVDRHSLRRWPAAVYSLMQTRRIARFERSVCQQADCVLTVSDEDAEALHSLSPGLRPVVVPNGIYVDSYDEDHEQLDLGAKVLTFTGKMDYRPNVDAMLWFCEAIWPQIQQNVPDAKLYIVGQKPHPRLEALRERPNIEVTGWVPDVRPFLYATDVYVAPLRMGSGTRLKLLEAMAAGCAVVATSMAASGLPPDVKKSIVLADGEAEMTQAVESLLHQPDRRASLGKNARETVKRYYDWSLLIPRLLSAYKEIGLG